ncbi:MAG TPA: hypothetical protein VEU72_02885 [Nitrosopumilaceae archaeon]|nr:hypothetical protein [Nitrosopumilaceae archaeon]
MALTNVNFQDEFVKDYFKNPFLWWNFIIFIFTTFNTQPTFNTILQNIIINSYYVQVLFACLGIALFLMFYPIRRSLKKLNKKKYYVHASLLVGVLFVHVAFFMSDPPVILGKLWSEVIIKPDLFDQSVYTLILVGYLGVPFLYAFATTTVKKSLLEANLPIDDKPSKNLAFGGMTALVTVVMYFLYTFSTSFH